MGLKWVVKAEKVAPVSTRKVMDLAATWSITLNSAGMRKFLSLVLLVLNQVEELEVRKSLRCLCWTSMVWHRE